MISAAESVVPVLVVVVVHFEFNLMHRYRYLEINTQVVVGGWEELIRLLSTYDVHAQPWGRVWIHTLELENVGVRSQAQGEQGVREGRWKMEG